MNFQRLSAPFSTSQIAIASICLNSILMSAGCASQSGPNDPTSPRAPIATETPRAAQPAQPAEDVAINQATVGTTAHRPPYIDEAIFIGESVIRGEHLFEWAEGVSLSRSADPNGELLRAGLRLYIDHGTAVEAELTRRFIRDVRAKDGPRWNMPTQLARIVEARARAISPQRHAEIAQRVTHPGASMALLHDIEDHDIRHRYLELLQFGSQSPPWWHWMIPPLARADTSERLEVFGVLVKAASKDPLIAEAIVGALKDSRGNIRRAAADVISEIPSISLKMIPTLAAAMKDPDPAIRQSIVKALARCDRGNSAAVAAIADALNDADASVRQCAMDVRWRPDIESAEKTCLLITALRDPSPRIRRKAAFALQERNADSDEIMMALTRAVDEGNFIVREALADALARAQERKTTTLLILKETADHGQTPAERAYARAALKQVAAGNVPAKPDDKK